MFASGKKKLFTSRFYTYRSTAQSIPTNVSTLVEFDAKDYDNDSEFDHVTNHDFIVKKSGFYHLSATVQILSLSDGEGPSLNIIKNGGGSIASDIIKVGGAGRSGVQANSDIYLVAGDVITVEIYKGTVAGSDDTGTDEQCCFSAHRFA